MKILKYVAVFLVAVVLLTLLLVASAKIPQSAIRENLLKSAEFLCDGPLFGTVVEGVEGSRIDRYADSILLAIAWQYDSQKPLESVMRSAYYFTSDHNENENLLEAVTAYKQANQQYLRYWHGSIGIVRPLLILFSLEQIYLLNALFMTVLTAWLMVLLTRKKAYAPALGIGLGLIMTSAWFVPLSLEYTWCFLLMLVGTIGAVKLAYAGKWQHMGMLFLLSGIMTNFLDFLTTETLTLLVPLLTLLWIDLQQNKKQSISQRIIKTVKSIFAWASGYAGMWVAKWILAALVLGDNVLPYVLGHVSERMVGDLGLPILPYLTGAILRNIRCLFPLEYGTAGILGVVVLVMFASYAGYVYHKKEICWQRIALFAVIGLVPYMRYLVLHNHSWLHCFFTYRAQLSTIMAAVMILNEVSDWRWYCLGNAPKR